jgi:predicted alpha/beta-hydrolase family hydrolase
LGLSHVPEFLITEPPQRTPVARFLCAHGAGAGMTSAFLTHIAALLAERGIATHRFLFAYMQQGAARPGRRSPPPRAERLMGEYRAAASAMPPARLTGVPVLIGGKSLGGRVASLVADELHASGGVAGLVCLGYPFHPPGRPQQLRTAHLSGLACPTLIVQGERDPFGTRAEIAALSLSPAIRIAWMPEGDHDLTARRARSRAPRESLAPVADAIAAFAQGFT